MIVGVLSDTHGLLRPETIDHLRDVDHIIHAGDIGKDEVIQQLKTLAPVSVVRGNVDSAGWAQQYPDALSINLAGHSIHILHIINNLNQDIGSKVSAVIYGHSHKPLIEYRNDVLYFNPGSCGPRRFRLPVSMGRLAITEDGIQAELISLVQNTQ